MIGHTERFLFSLGVSRVLRLTKPFAVTPVSKQVLDNVTTPPAQPKRSLTLSICLRSGYVHIGLLVLSH